MGKPTEPQVSVTDTADSKVFSTLADAEEGYRFCQNGNASLEQVHTLPLGRGIFCISEGAEEPIYGNFDTNP
jgi:hypothetical protein